MLPPLVYCNAHRNISSYVKNGLSQWSHGLRRGSAAACLLGLRVRILPGARMSMLSVFFCQVEVSATS